MRLNLRPWIHRLKIKDKDLRIEFLNLDDEFAWAQKEFIEEIERQYNAGLPVRIIVLKGRQLGISTATEGVLYSWTFIHPGTTSLVIAHETKAARHLFDMTKLMWEQWPFRNLFHEKHNTQQTLSWLETRSAMAVATARNTGSGRSFTYHAVHCSEAAFWEDPETLWVGLSDSIPYKHGTIVVIESTANGIGNWYHSTWLEATAGTSPFVPMFFPWWRHKEYSFPSTSLTERDYTKEERLLAKDYNLSAGQIAWRRFKIAEKNGDINAFKQEYPCSPDEAFLSTGLNVFPLKKLSECFEQRNGHTGMLIENNGKLQFIEDPSGPLTIFKLPGHNQRSKYVVAGDPSKTTYGDGACAQVINRYTHEQVAVWHGQVDPVRFAHVLMELGYFYNTALLNTEIEGPGYATIGICLELGYPDIWKHRWADKAPGKISSNYGFSTNYQRKHEIMAKVVWMLSNKSVTIHDQITYDQMKLYVTLDNGELGPASYKEHDDAVMAYAIAIHSSLTEPLDYSEPEGNGISIPEIPNNDLFNVPPWEAVS